MPLVWKHVVIFVLKRKAIKRKKLHIVELKEAFSNSNTFTLDELFSFYNSIEPGVPRNTVKWRAYELSKLGILESAGRGIYQIGKKTIYTPELTSNIKSLYKKLKAQFPFAEFCIWDTRLLNEFMIHQPAKFMIIVETESDVTESLFYFLKETQKKLFLNPDENIIKNYISGESNAIIIKPLISEAPTMLAGNIETISLEKMLVDICCDSTLFITFQGAELENIFMNSIKTYSLNQSKLFRYAARRGRRTEIEMLFKKHQTSGNN